MSTLAVYDCTLFFRAASRPAVARPVFDLLRSGEVTLCLDGEVLGEICDVMTRPKLIAKYPALTATAVDAFLAQLLRFATWIEHVPEEFVLTRDPKDSKYLNLAIAANAKYIVTTDLDLLDLMSSDAREPSEFRRRFPDLHVLNPADFEAIITKRRV